MAQSTSPISGVAERYAGSLFELAAQSNAIAAVERDLASFETMLEGSEDLQRLIKSPVFSADDQFKAIASIADKAGISGLTGNFLRVVAMLSDRANTPYNWLMLVVDIVLAALPLAFALGFVP